MCSKDNTKSSQLTATTCPRPKNGRTPLPEAPSVLRRRAAMNNIFITSKDAIPSPITPSLDSESTASPSPVASNHMVSHSSQPPTGSRISTASSTSEDESTKPSGSEDTDTFMFAGVRGRVITIKGEERFFCIECKRHYSYYRRSVATHYNHAHDPSSSFSRLRAPLPELIYCSEYGCDSTFNTKQAIINHHRHVHGYKGKSDPILALYGF
ncbi:hypothetical protein F4813DRAFT_394676 [Daldinia decipiens]|uniref:uncharacterized protein n=1 Tax=Daldinia decipiens TaxID=326647 RepID=UPI0020C22599|nr:uncharacterized protein F4813DRAFT_394676 [Daldinia decipiens]KAI1652464.1 hypothetical protein F4813DRAFT_394676 [Daldinia decipiens]